MRDPQVSGAARTSRQSPVSNGGAFLLGLLLAMKTRRPQPSEVTDHLRVRAALGDAEGWAVRAAEDPTQGSRDVPGTDPAGIWFAIRRRGPVFSRQSPPGPHHEDNADLPVAPRPPIGTIRILRRRVSGGAPAGVARAVEFRETGAVLINLS